MLTEIINSVKSFFGYKENRSAESDLEAILTGKNYASYFISKKDALNIPALATSVNFIASTVAGLPVKLFERDKDGVITPVEKDPRLKILNDDTGDLLDANQAKRALICDMLLDGNGYAVVERDNRNETLGFFYVDNQYVTVIDGIDKIKKAVKIYINGVEYPEYFVFRLVQNSANGVTGIGILQQNALLFNTMLNALKYENTAVSGGTKRGFLKSKYRLEQDKLDQLKSAWRKLFSTDVNNSPDVMVLNEGISFEPAASTATENQLNESKRTNSDLVYNLFGLSTNLFETSSGTGGEEIYINAVKTAILPVVNALNTAINKFLLLESEKERLFFAIDVSEILKSGVLERYKGYEIAIKSGWLQVDEVRKLENLPPLGLKFVKLGLGDVLYNPQTQQIYAVNTNTATKLGSKGKEGTPDDTSGDPS